MLFFKSNKNPFHTFDFQSKSKKTDIITHLLEFIQMQTSRLWTSSFVGAILMIIGTSIGGGMLALPIVTANGGILFSSLFLISCWLLMTAGAFLILEVNLLLPEGTNLISMAKKTLGIKGEVVAWISYLMLLYCLLSAYAAGGGEVIHHFFSLLKMNVSYFLSVILFVLLFACVLIRGISSVDKVNRIIMALKLLSFFFILTITFSNIQIKNFEIGHPKTLIFTITTMVTSFGFAIIVPSLRTYLKSDVKKLRLSILIGSLIPLIFYLLWEFVIFGVIPVRGPYSLEQLSKSPQPVQALVDSLTHNIQQSGLPLAANIFTTVCIFTAFLGVSLCLIDFLSDGLKINRNEKKIIFVYALTFIPPVLFVLFIPSLFTFGIRFAGLFCMILLSILPAIMVWFSRYHQKLPRLYKFFGEKPLIICVVLFSILVIVISLFENFYFTR